MKRRGIAVLLGVAMSASTSLYAVQQTAQTTVKVTARVNAFCQITASDLDFGAYSAQSSTPLQVSTMLRATCTPETTYNIGLNEGASPGATVTARKMVSGANSLNYQLYSDVNRTKIWGNTVPTNSVWGVGTGTELTHTVYGSVPAKQVVPEGDYSDTISVRLYY